MGCDLGFNGGGWPILVVVGLVIFGLQSGFRCVGLVFRWLQSGLVVFGLLVICSLLVCRGFARRGSGFARCGFGFCFHQSNLFWNKTQNKNPLFLKTPKLEYQISRTIATNLGLPTNQI